VKLAHINKEDFSLQLARIFVAADIAIEVLTMGRNSVRAKHEVARQRLFEKVPKSVGNISSTFPHAPCRAALLSCQELCKVRRLWVSVCEPPLSLHALGQVHTLSLCARVDVWCWLWPAVVTAPSLTGAAVRAACVNTKRVPDFSIEGACERARVCA
jgi:hypothetical protein